MANAFDEFDVETATKNAFDEYTTNTPQVEQIGSQVEAAKGPFERTFGSLVQPTAPELFSWKDVGTSTAMGVGLGATFGGIPGAAIGGVTGFTSGVAGEIMGTTGASPLNRFTAELVAGGIPQITTNLAQRFGTSIRTRNLAKLFKEPEIDQKANELAKTILFGNKQLPKGYTVENQDATQAALRKQFLGETDDTLGNFAPGKKVSDILREKLYTGLQATRDITTRSVTRTPVVRDVMGVPISGGQRVVSNNQNAFIRSPEYKLLLEDLEDLKESDELVGTSLKSLKTILNMELSTRPNVRENASQSILNLIQHGGVWELGKKGAEMETRTKINEATRTVLKKRFDEYLERNMGSKAYSELKAAEAAEFVAAARDEIPMILQTDFKYGSPQMNSVLDSIKRSPEGKKDFATAVIQHIRSFDDPVKMKSELNRLRAALKEAEVLSPQEISNIYKNIEGFKGLRDKATLINRMKNTIIFPLIGVAGSESANQRKAAPLDVFSM
jgi:hypothetical protein